MLLLALALATMPQPVGRTLPGDLGAYGALYAETKVAATRLDLTVDATGQPVRCEVTVSDGDRALDRVACDMLMRRARFTPARDAAGVAVAAVVRQDFTINSPAAAQASGGAAGAARKVDFALPVAHLPERGLPVADLLLMTDAGGRVTSCDLATSTSDAGFDRLACREVRAATFTPARGRDGTPMPALREVSVGFVTGDVPR